MPLTPQGEFTFKHTNQADTPNVSAATLKGQWDIQANELKATLNNLITQLEKNTETSGAQQIGSLLITDIDGTTIHAQLLSLRDKLKSITDGASGADFINATAITGLAGGTVQALLEALKNYADLVGVALTDALTTHKTSSDHDGRYFTENELNNGQLDNRYFTEAEMQASTDGSSGADKTGATQVSAGSGITVQAILEWLYLQITNTAIGQIPDGSLTPAKFSFDPATQAELDALAGVGNTKTVKQLDDAIIANVADYVRSPAFGPATGAVNVYTFSAMPATALVDGMSVYLDNVIAANTGASTFNWSGLGAKAIVDSKGAALTAGKMPLNCIIGLRYNASTSSFQLLGEGGDYGTAGAGEVLTGFTVGRDAGIVPGTLSLTGNAADADVLTGKTYYNTDAKTKRTGTLAPGKKWREGTATLDASGGLAISGLDFTPSSVIVYQRAAGGPNNIQKYVQVGSKAVDIYDNTNLRSCIAGYTDQAGTNIVTATGSFSSSFGSFSTFSSNTAASLPVKWKAYE